MLGVVLCGGESKRMGFDKGSLVLENKRWAEIVLSNLSALQIHSVISVNKTQVKLYSQIFPADQLVTDNESIPLKGPLLGLLSVHRQCPGEDLLVIACDMINMQPSVLQNLLMAYHLNTNDACVFITNQKIQTLCGIYTSRGLKHLLDLCLKNQLKKFSMVYALELLNPKYIPAHNFSQCFANYNSVEDIAANKSIGRMS